MDVLDPPTLQVVGGWLLVAMLFVLREVASGALKVAGKELWDRMRQRRRWHAPGCFCDPSRLCKRSCPTGPEMDQSTPGPP